METRNIDKNLEKSSLKGGDRATRRRKFVARQRVQ